MKVDTPSTVGFPKTAMKVSFTFNGTVGAITVSVLNSSSKVVWTDSEFVSSTLKTVEGDRIAASGSYTLRISYTVAHLTYTARVTAKGRPF